MQLRPRRGLEALARDEGYLEDIEINRGYLCHNLAEASGKDKEDFEDTDW
jgi:hypothetical protein